MIIYISFDVSNADSSKESTPFQKLIDTESDEKGNYIFLRETFFWVNWVINMLFLIPLPELLDDTPKKEDRKRFYTVGNIPKGKYLPQLKSSFLFFGKL